MAPSFTITSPPIGLRRRTRNQVLAELRRFVLYRHRAGSIQMDQGQDSKHIRSSRGRSAIGSRGEPAAGLPSLKVREPLCWGGSPCPLALRDVSNLARRPIGRSVVGAMAGSAVPYQASRVSHFFVRYGELAMPALLPFQYNRIPRDRDSSPQIWLDTYAVQSNPVKPMASQRARRQVTHGIGHEHRRSRHQEWNVVVFKCGIGRGERERFELRHCNEQPVERIAMMIRQLRASKSSGTSNRPRSRPRVRRGLAPE